MHPIDSPQVVATLFQQGLALHRRGRFAEAQAVYEQVLARQSAHFDALHLLGVIHLQSRHYPQALGLIRKAIGINARDATSHSNLGLALEALGRWEEALAGYERAIAIEPNYTDAHYCRGKVLKKIDRPGEAIASFDRVLSLEPRHAAALFQRAVALHQVGRLEEAIAAYDRVIADAPGHAEAHGNRGVALQALGRFDDAVASFDRALAIRPDADAYSNRAIVLQKLRRWEEAVDSYDRAIAIRPAFAQAYYNRAVLLQTLGRFDDAIDSCDRAIAIEPGHWEAHSNRGAALQALRRWGEAVASYDVAIAIRPDCGEAYTNRGSALQSLGRLDEALDSLDRAIEYRPGYAAAYNNRGNALKELGRLDEALTDYERAITLKPDYADAFNNRGVAWHALERLDEAIADYDRAIALNPNDAEAYWNKSLALLVRGDFDDGWHLYESRWKRMGAPKRGFSQPLWTGAEPLLGKTLLLHAEQGLGDSIQFCRYAKRIAALGAKVVLEAQRPLLGLLERLDGVSQVIETGGALPAFDYHCPLLSLPRAFGTRQGSIPGETPYLKSDAAKLSAWSRRLGERTRPRVGLVWSGSSAHANDRNRSLRLLDLIELLPRNCDYVSLQKEVRAGDEQALERSSIKRYGHELTDFGETAALCDLVDVVVSVDTSVAHLAGALGRPTWILLPFAPDWRWLLGRDDSPWYPSVKLYRQAQDRRWRPVLERVAADLSQLRAR